MEMRELMVVKRWGAVAGLLALAACGPNMVGTRYVKSQDAAAGQATLLTVSAAESPELAGTRLDIPIGALQSNTTLTVELGLNSILGAELSAGPVAVLGPVNTTFSGDATLTLPVVNVAGTDDVGIVAEDEFGTSWEIDPHQVALNATRTLATFHVRRLGTFQPRRRVACTSDSQCAAGLACVSGRCRTQNTTDGGSQCAMTCPMGSVCDPVRQTCTNTNACRSNADCAQNLACVNGACTVPNTTSCTSNGSMGCASGQVCVMNVCVPVQSDGGTTNPNACMSNADCARGELCLNGACRWACTPRPEACNMVDDDCDGIVDEGCNTNDGGVFCGGIGNIPCATGQVCIDDPNDTCDPMTGADCSGICVPATTDGGTRGCGGIAGLQCAMGEVCVDDPNDTCDPMTGADCPGVCVGVMDGGMADGGTTADGGLTCSSMNGVQCGAGQVCVDDPNDMCDPLRGLVCPGVCITVMDGGSNTDAGMGTDGGMNTSDGGIANDAGMGNACRTSMECAMGQSCVNGVCR
jgi:hypothetical protein